MRVNTRPASVSAVPTAVPASWSNPTYSTAEDCRNERGKNSQFQYGYLYCKMIQMIRVSYRLVAQWIHKKYIEGDILTGTCPHGYRWTPQKWGEIVSQVSVIGRVDLRRRVWSFTSWIHRVMKHKMVPANCCQCVGVAVAPTDALDKVLVLPIPVPAKGEHEFLTKAVSVNATLGIRQTQSITHSINYGNLWRFCDLRKWISFSPF